jgi:hypothetical protein
MSLLLPADGCPDCITETICASVHPYRLEFMPAEDSGRRWVHFDAWVKAFYRCPRCRYSWWTGWSPGAINLPCPGCDLCQPESGAA